MNRIAAIGNLHQPIIKFGNDFCAGAFKASEQTVTAKPYPGSEYIYPIFETLN